MKQAIILLAIALASCKTVHKSATKSETSSDSTGHQSSQVVKQADVVASATVVKTDSGTVTKDKQVEVIKTTTTKFDSVGRKTEQTTVVKTTGNTHVTEQKAAKEAGAIALTDHSRIDSSGTKNVAVQKQESHSERIVEKKKFSFPWFWLIVAAIVGLAYWQRKNIRKVFFA